MLEFMQPSEENQLLRLLDERHSWPDVYLFKFIVPKTSADSLRSALPDAVRVDSRDSTGGKYTALTFHCAMASGREVLSVYANVQACGIPGLISL